MIKRFVLQHLDGIDWKSHKVFFDTMEECTKVATPTNERRVLDLENQNIITLVPTRKNTPYRRSVLYGDVTDRVRL